MSRWQRIFLKEITFTKALLVVGIGLVVIVTAGTAIGYTWFWNRYDAQSHLEQQVRKYQAVLKEDPTNITALTELGWTVHKLGHTEQAVQLFQKVLDMEPNNVGARYNLALANAELGNAAAAERELAALVDKYPRHELAWLGLGQVLLEQEKFEEAVAALDRFLTINPTGATGHYLKGTALEQLGKEPQALECYIQALKFDPQYSEALAARNRLQQRGE